ncbi:oligosaccharide flippase family protein [Ginsengibacter hankyongi]|uniref:Oligosaccharide flippase family protein n=1 Tax=Ginsengibacter hankyongi TaxID=2607284 RepID=A0A5J5INE8_9BACT|nr:oligosaccharide flippase family protein [Ginsengibacter hankyongi]KAA9041444.1 oligosaccharide flippase family protein [Ginsengibacter hankyongi]
MSSIKKLAGQTVWYGVSSIAARFLFYLLTPYFTYKLSSTGYGDMSILYAAIPFLNVIFTYGIETTYFRFASKEDYKKDIYSTATISILCSTILLTSILILSRASFAHLLRLDNHPEFITYSALIIGLDTLTTLPFAKLRLDQRPRKYALIRVSTIILQILITYFLISVCPSVAKANPYGFIATFYKKGYGVGYVIIANLCASFFALVLLHKEFFAFEFKFNKKVWSTMMVYSLPLLIVGFGGMINETFDRIMLTWLAPVDNITAAKDQVAIYSACYKLSILITLFIQAFRMGAEPFFFKQAEGQNPQKVYARVMKFFVITITIMFLVVAMYLDIWKYFLTKEPGKLNIYWTGLKVVPILLLANMFLGIYYNLSIWYKLTHKTIIGAYITLIGAGITLIINYIFIPYFSYMACAWATFFCYGSMMVISFLWGQKQYRIPYAWKKLCAYILIVVLLFFIHEAFTYFFKGSFINLASATILLLLYLWFVMTVEIKELQRIPFLKKFLPGNYKIKTGAEIEY